MGLSAWYKGTRLITVIDSNQTFISRWLEIVPSTFQDVDFKGSLQPLYIG